jgi:tryptophan synthase alpha chain
MRFEDRFNELKEKKTGAFMPYVCCGDPDVDFTRELVGTLYENGADVLEFGFPFSDPIADGPTIQKASMRALGNGMNTKVGVETIGQIRKSGVDIPIVVMTYYNLILKPGVDDFIRDIGKAGAQGILAPDVPLEEVDTLLKCGRKHDVDVIFLVTPATTDERLKQILDVAMGFVYVVTVAGTTGARESVADTTLSLVRRVREHSDLPVAVGFGISRPEHARAMIKAGAGGVIVGSKIIDIYSKKQNRGQSLREVGKFAREMRKACILR